MSLLVWGCLNIDLQDAKRNLRANFYMWFLPLATPGIYRDLYEAPLDNPKCILLVFQLNNSIYDLQTPPLLS